jgi:hypothetical protein
MKKTLSVAVTILVIFSTMLVSSTALAQDDSTGIVNVSIQSSSITWTPTISNIKGVTLTIAGPGSFYFQKQYDASAHPTISSGGLGDGPYNYEIVLSPSNSHNPGTDPSLRGLNSQSQSTMKQSGTFTVLGGSFVTAAKEPSQAGSKTTSSGGVKPFDDVVADDLVVQGSICAGLDCVNNESFGYDTIRLKANNLRIGFMDTSTSVGFPSNDWTIVANDLASGGANFLGFEDVTGAKFPFKVMAGAPTDSLFVSSNGDVGLGTSTPVLDLHITRTDTPGMRLEQTNGGGFTAQTWDVAGNEANFFVRDVTGGSRLPFRIRPGAPTSSIDIAANGNVGIGTASPTFDLDVANTGAAALMAVRRTDGSTLRLAAGIGLGSIGTTDNAPLGFLTNSVQKMTLATDGSLTVVGPVNATAFNVTSDKNVKENFGAVDQKTVLERLSAIPISTWNFIENDNKTKHMGPMAQDFYAAFGLGADNKHISTVDADGVAFAAIQELNKQNQALSSENASLHSKVDDLAARISTLESGTSSGGQSSQDWLIVLLVGMNLGLIVLLVWAIRRGSFTGIKSGNQ